MDLIVFVLPVLYKKLSQTWSFMSCGMLCFVDMLKWHNPISQMTVKNYIFYVKHFLVHLWNFEVIISVVMYNWNFYTWRQDLIKIIQKYSGTLHEGISMFYVDNSDTQGFF